MFLTMMTWERIRDRFSEEEKLQVNLAITGEVVCPKGCLLDEMKLSQTVKEKLTRRIAA